MAERHLAAVDQQPAPQRRRATQYPAVLRAAPGDLQVLEDHRHVAGPVPNTSKIRVAHDDDPSITVLDGGPQPFDRQRLGPARGVLDLQLPIGGVGQGDRGRDR